MAKVGKNCVNREFQNLSTGHQKFIQLLPRAYPFAKFLFTFRLKGLSTEMALPYYYYYLYIQIYI